MSMNKIHPHKIGLDIKKNIDMHENNFTMSAECLNCNKYIGGIFVPKGSIVLDYEKSLTCDNCEVIGKIIMW